jgi:transposase InsO family protein
MSRKADYFDNAPMESFFHTLKTELVHHRSFELVRATHDELSAGVLDVRQRAFRPLPAPRHCAS